MTPLELLFVEAIAPLPRDTDFDSPAPDRDVYGYGRRHPKKPNIIMRFDRGLWTICAGAKMLLTTYDRERAKRFVENLV